MDELEKTKSISDLNIENLDIERLEALRKDLKENILNETENSYDFLDTNGVGNSSNTNGHALTKAASSNKVDHSRYPGMYNNGFATNIILGLLIAFASGAIVSTIYIFMNLGNSVFSL